MGSNYSSSDIKCSTKIITAGGGAIPGITDLNWCKGNGLTDWRNRINDDEESSVIIGYNADGLVPIWQILPEQYSDISNKLMKTFENEYASCYTKFKNYILSDNTKDYAGGDGSFAYPYKIENSDHLRNIQLNMDANYILLKDIDLSSIKQWEPIGGFYRNKSFTGIFDGNNKTIKKLTRTEDIEERNNRIYFGLFCEIANGGVVKNLKFSNLNIRMTGPSVNNASTWVYVGAVAASVSKASIINCKVESGRCEYDACTNGEVYTGAICGRADSALIDSCSNQVNVLSGRYTGIAGGICGYARNSDFYKCKNTASVVSKCTAWGGVSCAGGIAGMVYGSVSTDYCSGGSATIKADNYGGGISWTHKDGRLIGYIYSWER